MLTNGLRRSGAKRVLRLSVMTAKLAVVIAVIALIVFLFIFPNPCSMVTASEKFSPSHKWLARETINSCSGLGASYVVETELMPTKEYRTLNSSAKPEFVFFLDLTTLHVSPGKEKVETHWKDDQNLEITAPACTNVCRTGKGVEPCRNGKDDYDFCRIINPGSGINVVLTPSL